MKLWGTPIDRFNRKWEEDPVTGCHVWVALKYESGYGRFQTPDDSGKWRPYKANRWILAHTLGRPIGPGLMALHHCDNKACVNPDHLYEGTHAQNMKDRINRNPINGRADKKSSDERCCPHGHAYNEANTGYSFNPAHPNGQRYCKECKRLRRHRDYEKKKAQAA